MSVSDLTGTKWKFNDTISDSGIHGATYYIAGHITSGSDIWFCTSMSSESSYDSYIIFHFVQPGMPWVQYYPSNGWQYRQSQDVRRNIDAPIIEFTGGTGVTNATLIAWVENNATLIPSYTFDLSTLSLSSGTHTITAKAKATGYADSNASNSVSYTVSGGYQVTIENISEDPRDISVYDGEDMRSIYLGDVDGNTPFVTTVSSGHLCLYARAGQFQRVSETGGVSFVRTFVEDSSLFALYSVAGNGTTTVDNMNCFVEGTEITLADGSRKKVEDITMDDELLVWNFYEGKFDTAKPMWIMQPKEASRYNLVTFENGTTLGLVGSNGFHRIYNDEAKAFTYTGTEDTPNSTTTFCDDGFKTIVVAQEIVEQKVRYYNIITEKHYNLFANGILTSCRLSNRYAIEDMRYDTAKVNMTEEEVKKYIEKLR